MTPRQPDDLGVPPDPASRPCILRMLVFGAIFALVGVLAGLALGDAPRVMPGPGFDICTTKGC